MLRRDMSVFFCEAGSENDYFDSHPNILTKKWNNKCLLILSVYLPSNKNNNESVNDVGWLKINVSNYYMLKLTKQSKNYYKLKMTKQSRLLWATVDH